MPTIARYDSQKPAFSIRYGEYASIISADNDIADSISYVLPITSAITHITNIIIALCDDIPIPVISP